MLSIFAIIVICFLATSFRYSVQSPVDDHCPPGLPRDEFRQLYSNLCLYFAVYRRSEYLTAEQDCVSHGGSLVLVKSSDIQDFIVTQMTGTYKQGHSRVWIGLDDLDGDGVFRWLDGSTPAYTNWALGEGLGRNPGEVCAVLDVGQRGKWYDYSCRDQAFSNYEQPYVCQFVTGPVTGPTVEIVTVTETSLTHPCPPFSCDLDCGMDGFRKNVTDGCALCECDA